ncbi:hypothetical protein AX15_002143 [Amanita polypyramis BW_CC]|nr:hypothetical protein AX15_002143 [Amanita polypyramis BW_CC]
MHAASSYPPVPPAQNTDNDRGHDSDPPHPNVFLKGPKRKRLAKACDACHKSKRRCDGTAPCSNCYYASKSCTYTDASGRPVPAPRPFNTERNDPQPSSSSYAAHYVDAGRYTQPLPTHNQFSGPTSSTQGSVANITGEDNSNMRKRIRNDKGNLIPADDTSIDGPISGPSMEPPTPIRLDHQLTRELTNLFFTHCHPARIIIHKPSFSTYLSHNRVPLYLIYAICALAAPLSRQTKIRTNPARFAGRPFAQEAMSIMFDGAGRLICEANLATAQALCLLQMHDIITKDKNMRTNTRYHDLALQIAKVLGVHNPDHPLLTPTPSPEFIQESLEREAIRRIFWLIHMLDIMTSIYFRTPLTIPDNDLRLRLPADETSFELGVHSTLPEYLHLPPIKNQYASEFGHLLRVLVIYAKVEEALDYLTGVKEPGPSINPAALVYEAGQQIKEWSSQLSDHLQFSRESLSVQHSMFETSSNDGAWCYCCMHVYHASTLIALNNAQQLLQMAPMLKVGPQWATDMLDQILTMLGERGKHSLLMSAALWTYAGLCGRDDPQVHVMARDYEDHWGTRILHLVQNWRSRMSPHHQQLHQFITPPQKYGQPTSFRRRKSCDTSFSDAHSGGHSFGVTPIQMQTSGTDSSRTDISRPSTGQSIQSSVNHQSPTLSSASTYNSVRYPEETSHLNSNNPTWRQQPDGRMSTSASVYFPNSGTIGPGVNSGSANNGQGHTLSWDHRESERDRGRHQSERVKNENDLPIGNGSFNGVIRDNANADKVQRAFSGGNNGEGPQSLPSLKDSGLLDSWTQTSRMPDRLQENLPRKSPLSALQRQSPGQMDTGSDAPRNLPSTTIPGVPVGLSWLANESR